MNAVNRFGTGKYIHVQIHHEDENAVTTNVELSDITGEELIVALARLVMGSAESLHISTDKVIEAIDRQIYINTKVSNPQG